MVKNDSTSIHPKNDNELKTTTLANGCFWCTEAIFSRVMGIKSVMPGYSGGKTSNPSYEEVCTGITGHAEAIQILEIFWHIHDPTTLNRQGNDVGTQYRSVIFYHDEDQKNIAEKTKKELEKEGIFK